MGHDLKISKPMVRKLVDSQFPQWKSEQLMAVGAAGTDNQLYRLGADKCVRLPRVEWAAETAGREQALLGRFQDLPLEVSRPLGLGSPGEGYPWEWSVVSWIEGQALGMRQLRSQEAVALAETIHAIRQIVPDRTAKYGQENYGRGGPLSERDELFRKAAKALGDEFDESALCRVWAMCLEDGGSEGSPVFLHGDLHGGNLLERDGTLCAVIDWGLAGVGDGACDLSAAWCLCDAEVRPEFRDAMKASEADWLRGAGWALSIACIYVAYYRDKPDVDCAMSRRTIGDVLEAFS